MAKTELINQLDSQDLSVINKLSSIMFLSKFEVRQKIGGNGRKKYIIEGLR